MATSPATVDALPPRWVVAGAVLAATGLGWLVLPSLMSDAVESLCGSSTGPFGLMAVWALMSTVMILPSIVPLTIGHALRDAIGILAGYLAITTAPGVLAGLLEWWLRTAGLMLGTIPASSVQAQLITVAVIGLGRDALVRDGPRDTGADLGLRHLGMCTAMAALQLAFGSMQLLLMAALSLWMLAIVLLPDRAERTTNLA